MTGSAALDLVRIEASLVELQGAIHDIDALAGTRRDPMDRQTIDNMLAGYQWVERAVGAAIDIFAPGASKHLLVLNGIVLCGNDEGRRSEHASHMAATERRYYDEPNAGIGDLVEWYRANANACVWDLAAGAYMRLLAKPQLFIEGNHRTGALLMSYMLMRACRPPFVLTRNNAPEFFGPSSEIRDIRKGSLRAFFQLPRMRRRMAALLRRESDARYLRPGPAFVRVESA